MLVNLDNDTVDKRLEDFSVHALPKKGNLMCAKFHTIYLIHLLEK